MKSKAADTLSEQTAATVRDLSVSDRVALALRLGDEAVKTFASFHNISLDQARSILRRNNQLGRRQFRETGDE